MSWGAISTSLVGDAERLGDELREDRLGALAHLGRGGQDATRPSAVSSSEATAASLTSPEPVNPAPCQARARPIPLAVRSRSVRSGRSGTDARARAPPPRVLGPGPQPDELGGLGRPLQDLLPGDAVAQDLAGRRRVARAVDVAPADVERREAERLGDPVEVGLGRELGLRRPEPAERAVGRRVRPRRPGPDADVRAAVRAAGVEGAAATARPA